jgi:glutamate dehydrogenase (NAD(P)+)
VDVLVPAATGHVFTAGVARRVKARMVVEGANGPTPREGDAVLAQRGIPVVPDILANSGGVIASYVEWRQAKSGSLTPRADTFETVDSLIREGLCRVIEAAKKMKCSYRMAAHSLAVEEVVNSMRDRGWF